MSGEPPRSAHLSALDARGVGIRIRFYWNDDRYSHQIEAVDGLFTRTLLESVESELIDDWPTSPPLTYVSVSWIASDHEQGHVAMLVGTTSKSHWSLCVSARDRRTTRPDESCNVELFFDVACRTVEPPKFLGSTYRALGQQVAVSERLNCAFVPANTPGLVLLPQDSELELDRKRESSLLIRCRANDVMPKELPATLRWRYAIRRSSGGPLQIAKKQSSP